MFSRHAVPAALMAVLVPLLLVGCGSDTADDARSIGPLNAQTAQCQLLGDMDGDGNPSVSDAIAILRIVVGLAQADPLADCDQSGTTLVNDAIMVLRCVVGLADWPIGQINCVVGTIEGYVIDTLSTAQDDATKLGFATETSDDVVAFSIVEVQSGATTTYVRTLMDGYFAVEVPAGQATLTALLPEETADWFLPSDPLNVTVLADRLVSIEGTDLGPVPVVQPGPFMPINVGDKRYLAVDDWTPDMIWPAETARWGGVVIGTTTIDGAGQAYVLASPLGDPDAVRTMQDDDTLVFGDYAFVAAPGANNSIIIYGEALPVRTPEGEYQVIGCLYNEPIVLADLVLGREYSFDTADTQQVLDVQLAQGLTLEGLHDLAMPEYVFDGCLGGGVLSMRVAAIGAPTETSLQDFNDTLVLCWTSEITGAQLIAENVQFRTWARDVGAIQEVGQRAIRESGETRSEAVVDLFIYRDLIYANVGGVEYGDAPLHRLVAYWDALQGSVNGEAGPLVQWCSEYPTCDDVGMTLNEDGTLQIEFYDGATELAVHTGTWTQVGNQLTISRDGYPPWVCTYQYAPFFLTTTHIDGDDEHVTEWFGT